MTTLATSQPADRSASGNTRVVRVVMAGIAAMTLWGLAIALVGILTPKYVELFRDFGVTLPAYSRLFIEFAGVLRTPLFAGVIVLVPLLITVALATAALRGDRAGFVALVLFALAALIPIAGFVVAMVIPASRLASALRASGAT